MRKIVFIDRDGTIIHEPKDTYQIDRVEVFNFLPGTIAALKQLVQAGWELVLVTNQDGMGTPSFPAETFWPLHMLMHRVLASEGIHFLSEHIDVTTAEKPGPSRKPGTGMLQSYLAQNDWSRAQSCVVGDRTTDLQLALNLGVKGIFLAADRKEAQARADFDQFMSQNTGAAMHYCANWPQAVAAITGNFSRQAHIERKTAETRIAIDLDLDDASQASISTGIGFFDHMLHQISRHGKIGLNLKANGDLHIDSHHTIEDTGIALGQALAQAWGDKRGIDRYGFWLPMDEADAAVTLDLSGRFFLKWQVQFTSPEVAGIPVTLFEHFFHSLANAAQMNLHITAQGVDNHHIIEAVFKAFARALRRAINRQAGNFDLPSTKELL